MTKKKKSTRNKRKVANPGLPVGRMIPAKAVRLNHNGTINVVFADKDLPKRLRKK